VAIGAASKRARHDQRRARGVRARAGRQEPSPSSTPSTSRPTRRPTSARSAATSSRARPTSSTDPTSACSGRGAS
jgi:hypothetical protein